MIKNIYILFLVVFLTEIATDIYVPTLPLFESIFDTNREIIQLSMSLHLLGFALGQPLYGPVSDYWGRKKTLLAGFTIFTGATILCLFASSITMLIWMRFIQGFGACVAPVIGMSMIKDFYGSKIENIKMLTLMTMTVSMSPIIGPILGTILAEYTGWKGSFYLLACCGIALLPLIYMKLEETNHNRNIGEFNMKSATMIPLFILVLMNALLVSCVWMFITAAPFILMQTYEVPLIHYGYYQALTVVAYIFGGFITNRNIQKYGSYRLSALGLFGIGVAGLGLFLAWQVWGMSKFQFVAFVALMECGIGIFRPLIIHQIMDFYPQRSGSTAALIGTVEMVVSAIAVGLLGAQAKIMDITITSFITAITVTILLYAALKMQFRQPNNPMRIFTDR